MSGRAKGGRARGRAGPAQSGSGAEMRRPGSSDSSQSSSGALQLSAGSGGRSWGPPRAQQDNRQEQRPQSSGSGSSSDQSSGAVAASAGGDRSSVARGAFRGGRVLPSDIVTRPKSCVSKQGGKGQKIMLQANYFKLLTTTDWCIYQYAVSYAPEEDNTRIRKGLLRQSAQQLGPYIFDGALLYTSQRLPQPLELHTQRRDGEMIRITIKEVGDLAAGDYHYIQFFNIIMRKCLEFLDLKLVGRNYFDPVNKLEVREWKFEVWPGYETSIRQHERDILMCAEITHKVMRNETVYDILKECFTQQNGKQLFQSTVIGTVVLTGYNNNTYRITDVDFNNSPQSTFKKKDGTEISYIQYYKDRYQIHIRDVKQPLLLSLTKPRDRRAGKEEYIYLIPELCRSTGMTDTMKSNFRLMSALAKHTRVSPGDRIRKLMTFNQRLHNVPSITNEFRNWNLTLDTELVKVPARILPPEVILYGNNATSNVPNNANWTNDLRGKSLRYCQKLSDWAIVYPSRMKQDCQNFLRLLAQVAGGMGFAIEKPSFHEINSDRAGDYANMLEEIKSRRNPMLIFCAVPNNRLDRYSAIKKKCCVDRPVPTQVVLSKTMQAKSVMSIATKVAIQINCKVGGIPWTVNIPCAGLMVVGFDVCHDTNDRSRDFGAMVASLDKDFGRYFSAVSEHKNGEELSNQLSTNLVSALHKFREVNKAFPSRIVIYRDGVGEGQIDQVAHHELNQIKDKLKEFYPSPQILRLTFIIVTKRINTRLFNREYNPSPGTVVDDVITDPSKYDFLIVPQHVNQGTVTPTSFNVIEDTCGLSVDIIQQLTYKLCHMYFNWSGTVRVPAPVQYAHKLAFLVSQAIHLKPVEDLNTYLYFL